MADIKPQIYMMIIAMIAALSSVALATMAIPVAADPKVCAGNPHDRDSGPNGNPHDFENGNLENGNPHDTRSHRGGFEADLCPGSK
jgi:hypothetical protein